ncbi:MAG: hypothetical protein ABIH11_00725 [Candidatus Altiarchaeota archaeon]
MRMHRVQHRQGAGDERKRIRLPEEEIELRGPEEPVRKRRQRKHKPVVDLYSYHATNVPKFNALAESNPGVKHIYVGYELDGGFSYEYAADGSWEGRTWDPGELSKRSADDVFREYARGRRREFSSKDVLVWLKSQDDNSVNRFNIDGCIPPKEVLKECMRVLEPGGAIEMTVPYHDKEVSDRVLTEMQLKTSTVPLSPLDLTADSVRNDLFEDKWRHPVKYIIEKPGGGIEVDRRPFWERLNMEHMRTLEGRVYSQLIMDIHESLRRDHGMDYGDQLFDAFRHPTTWDIFRDVSRLEEEDASRLRGVLTGLDDEGRVLECQKPLFTELIRAAKRPV